MTNLGNYLNEQPDFDNNGDPINLDFPISGSTTVSQILQKAYGISSVEKIETYHDFLELILSKHKSVEYVGAGVGGVLINDDNEVLLYKRDKDPEKGFWSMPGGSVQLKEDIQETIVREFRNITGLDIEIKKLRLLRITNHKHTPRPKDADQKKYHYLSPAFLIHFKSEFTDFIPRKVIKQHPFEKAKEARTGIKGCYDLKWVPIKQITDEKSRDEYTKTTRKAIKVYLDYEAAKKQIASEINKLYIKSINQIMDIDNYE